MAFHLSKKSYRKLEGVNPKLVETVERAIKISKVDFGVIYGVRTLDAQKKLYEAGRSQTMRSKHLLQEDDTSHAVDLMAYIGSRASWELNLYDDIADAMRVGAIMEGVDVTWGGAWHKTLNSWSGSSHDLMNEYIDTRRGQGRKPFIDGPHFQIEIN